MDDTTEVPMEVLAPSAVHALEKAAIDVQVATAHEYPRSLEKFRKRAMDMACLDAETAESCIYTREVGSEKVNGRWEKKFATGPSIRMAEIIACSYGNLRVAARVIEQTPRYVKCEGVAHDLETNFAGKSDIIESTVTRDGNPYSERQRALTAKVACAKAFRDAIFKVVPRSLFKHVIDGCVAIIKKEGKTIEQRRAKAKDWVDGLKIDNARVFEVLGVAGWSEVGEDHLMILTGLKTAMAEGEKLDEIFPPLESKAPPSMPGPETKAKPLQNKGGKDKPAVETKPETPKPEAPQQNAAEKAQGNQSEPTTAKPEESKTDVSTSSGTGEPAPGAEKVIPLPSPVSATPEPEPASVPPDPKLAPRQGDSDALASVKLLACKSGVAYSQIMGWARANKVAKEDQQLADLSEAKLVTMGTRWSTILPKIREIKP